MAVRDCNSSFTPFTIGSGRLESTLSATDSRKITANALTNVESTKLRWAREWCTFITIHYLNLDLILILIPVLEVKELPIPSNRCDLALLTAASLHINTFCPTRN
jgi:hypothetical protein